MSGKIEGGYSKYIDLILKKYNNAHRDLRDNLIYIDSYDGAECCNSNKGRTNIISFSTQALSQDTIRNKKPLAGSFGILTWQLVIAEEKLENIFPVCRKYLIKNNN